jgi:hypothetical protein
MGQNPRQVYLKVLPSDPKLDQAPDRMFKNPPKNLLTRSLQFLIIIVLSAVVKIDRELREALTNHGQRSRAGVQHTAARFV